MWLQYYSILIIIIIFKNKTELYRASGENRVFKPYPTCPRLIIVSFIYNNIMNYDYNISDI